MFNPIRSIASNLFVSYRVVEFYDRLHIYVVPIVVVERVHVLIGLFISVNQEQSMLYYVLLQILALVVCCFSGPQIIELA